MEECEKYLVYCYFFLGEIRRFWEYKVSFE